MIPGNQFSRQYMSSTKIFFLAGQFLLSRQHRALLAFWLHPMRPNASHQYHSIDFKEVSDERIFFR